ncbi:hypothetical protein MKX03_021459 [Papaver bracteatum]|nr:hypothetical protein MKX03_021459 [Papaver bracteatum]
MSRVRNIYKAVSYALRCDTLPQRLLKKGKKDGCTVTISSSHSLLIVLTKGELSKVAADYQDSNFLGVGIEFRISVDKLYYGYKHFKLHEEPDLFVGNLFRGYVLPSAAAVTVVTLIGEIAYRKHLKDKYQGNTCKGTVTSQLKVLSSFKANFKQSGQTT